MDNKAFKTTFNPIDLHEGLRKQIQEAQKTFATAVPIHVPSQELIKSFTEDFAMSVSSAIQRTPFLAKIFVKNAPNKCMKSTKNHSRSPKRIHTTTGSRTVAEESTKLYFLHTTN